MAIVHVGNLLLQVSDCRSRRSFCEQLRTQVAQHVGFVVTRCIEVALSTELTRLLRRPPFRRRRPKRFRAGEICCRRCGERDPHQFRRNGHYRRGLDTSYGRLWIHVPQVECCRCGASGEIPFQTLQARQRWWDDVEAGIRQQSVLGLSLREIQEQLSVQVGGAVGLRSINQRVHAAARALAAEQAQVLADVPPVVRVDGIWVRVMVVTDETHVDRRGRRRRVKTVAHVPILAAQGVWPATPRHEIIAWTVGQAEDRDSWEQLLDRLVARGVTPARGLRLVVGDGSAGLEEARQTVLWDVPFQRCIFHKLRNIGQAIAVPNELSVPARKSYRRRLIRSAARIWQAPTVAGARQRRAEFCQRWQEAQPDAVACLNRDFEATLTFYELLAATAAAGTPWPAHAVRTTSPLEREFRAWRKRLRSAVLFHSLAGLKAVISQFLFRRTAQRTGWPPGQWLTALERTIAAFPE